MKRLILFLLMMTFIVMLTGCSNKYEYSQQLIKAIEEDNLEQFTYLLEKGGDLDSRPHFLGLDRVNMPPLHYACSNGKIKYVKALVEAGADLNFIDNSVHQTPLMASLDNYHYENRLEIVKYLVEAGANVNVEVNGHNALGYTIRWNTVSYSETMEYEDFELVLYLIDKGADINKARLGNLILDAAQRNNLLIVKYMLTEQNVEIDLVDEYYGNSAIMWAVIWNNYEIVKYLVEQGANLDVVNKDGKTVFDLAFEQENLEGNELANNLKIQELLNEKSNNN